MTAWVKARALGIVWPFAPMHLRETLAAGGGTISDTLHLALGATTELIYVLALGLAATALGRAFRWYSIATLIALVGFGVMTFLEAPGLAAGSPTPLIGIWERINIGVFLLWVMTLAMVMLVRGRSRSEAPVARSRGAVEVGGRARRATSGGVSPAGIAGRTA